MAGVLKRWNGSEWVTVSGLTVILDGGSYAPTISHDTDLTYFYIDFGRAVQTITYGALLQSIYVVGNAARLSVLSVDYVSTGKYKITTSDMSGELQGIQIYTKETGIIKFSDGANVPQFSVVYYICGERSLIQKAETCNFPDQYVPHSSVAEPVQSVVLN
jgi:hypothetical protein